MSEHAHCGRVLAACVQNSDDPVAQPRTHTASPRPATAFAREAVQREKKGPTGSAVAGKKVGRTEKQYFEVVVLPAGKKDITRMSAEK